MSDNDPLPEPTELEEQLKQLIPQPHSATTETLMYEAGYAAGKVSRPTTSPWLASCAASLLTLAVALPLGYRAGTETAPMIAESTVETIEDEHQPASRHSQHVPMEDADREPASESPPAPPEIQERLDSDWLHRQLASGTSAGSTLAGGTLTAFHGSMNRPEVRFPEADLATKEMASALPTRPLSIRDMDTIAISIRGIR